MTATLVTAAIAALSALLSGGLVAGVMNARNDRRRIDHTAHDAEQARLDAGWAALTAATDKLRTDVARDLDRCRAENEVARRETEAVRDEANMLRKDVQQKGDQIIELQRELRRLKDEMMVVRRQVGEVAESGPTYRTRVEDKTTTTTELVEKGGA